MIKKIDHLVITTADFEACSLFYKKLGFEIKEGTDRLELFAGDFKINVHKRGAELFPHAENVSVGSNDLCFEVSSLNEIIACLKKENINIEVNMVERTGVKGKMTSIYLRDPDGNLLELSQYNL